MILPCTKGSLSLAFVNASLFCCIVLLKLLMYARQTLSHFLELSTTPISILKHDNLANIQYLKVKLSGYVVMVIR